MKIPSWHEVKEKVDHLEKGNPPVSVGNKTVFYTFTELDPIEAFVYDHEPAGKEGDLWRNDLQSLVDFLIHQKHPEYIHCSGCNIKMLEGCTYCVNCEENAKRRFF